MFFFPLRLDTGYWKLRLQETKLFEFIMSVWNITAPKKLDCLLLGFRVTIGEINSDCNIISASCKLYCSSTK